MSKGRTARKRSRTKQDAKSSQRSDTARGGEAAAPESSQQSGWRGWFEALVFAFLLAMFVRVFIFELFKIPTGSMIPTLIGGEVAHVDWDGDGKDELVSFLGRNRAIVFNREGKRFLDGGVHPIDAERARAWQRDGVVKFQSDRIFVNKFAYWFRRPDRGDIVVFKIPEIIWDPATPMYIKRLVGLPGDRMDFSPEGRIVWNEGKTDPDVEFFDTQHYKFEMEHENPQFHRFDYVTYGPQSYRYVTLKQVRVPEDSLYVMGDNTRSSLDSRYWGAFGANRLKGKAFFRYWPLGQTKFIH